MTDVASSESKIQQEGIQFNQPVSEASATAMAALANAMREIIAPVGTVWYSMLDEATFQDENTAPSPERWVLADGRNVSGSRYEALTGDSTVPDLRGVFIRGRNGARSGATGNPDGDLAVGTYSADKYNSHAHGVTDPSHSHGVTDPGHAHAVTDPGHNHGITDPGHNHDHEPHFGNAGNIFASGATRQALSTAPFGTGHDNEPAVTDIEIDENGTGVSVDENGTGVAVNAGSTGISVNANGGNETAPRCVTMNAFIRIN